MFSTRTPLLPLLYFLSCWRFRKLPALSFFVGSMIIQLCGSSTTRLIAEPEASSVKHMISTPFPSTNVRQMYPTQTMLASLIASPSNDSNTDSDTHTENPDSNLTDPGATLPHPSRVTVAFLILGVGLCLFSIYFLITHHPPSHVINKHVRPTISHISDRLPNSLVFLFHRLAVLGNRLSAHFPGISGQKLILSATIFGPFNSKFHRNRRRRRRGGPGPSPSPLSPLIPSSLSSPSSSNSFRVGEGRLVQWAQEDMGVLPDIESGESRPGEFEAAVDFMVNAEDPAESEELVDEYIPLSVGMGWKSRFGLGGPRSAGGMVLPVRNYGSATR
ncbi:uncharacterized protein C8R40DRAFT_583594 [Lentinula edodes]|uniref:uncharacterized protein n=1 Tax=Lentinula edodes TaxID=5353 RepID=UPI001E8CDAA0|nr:uncharacterized protein C8R40DRAFT_583594 [Lentinula edodes]KAH7879199.1 hypothetical protein C8R40DRAFT_583594 [Lentinula edodes]